MALGRSRVTSKESSGSDISDKAGFLFVSTTLCLPSPSALISEQLGDGQSQSHSVLKVYISISFIRFLFGAKFLFFLTGKRNAFQTQSRSELRRMALE